MSYVSNICIAKEAGGKIEQINSIEVIANKGILKDRYFKKDSEKEMNQITLIESENVDYYNQLTGANLLPTDFRRNIITRGISLNKLVGEKILVGKVMMKVHDLCDPCRYLQELLCQKNLVKKFLNRGGLRCELLTSGSVHVNDAITIL